MGILKGLFNNPINKFERKLFDNDPLNKELFGDHGAETILGLPTGEQTPPPVAQVVTPEEPKTLLTPTAMPTITGDPARQAKRKSLASQMARKGRASTILTQDDGLGASG